MAGAGYPSKDPGGRDKRWGGIGGPDPLPPWLPKPKLKQKKACAGSMESNSANNPNSRFTGSIASELVIHGHARSSNHARGVATRAPRNVRDVVGSGH
jgi:hypothetical protein